MNADVARRLKATVCRVVGIPQRALWEMRPTPLHAHARGVFVYVAIACYPYNIPDIARRTEASEKALRRSYKITAGLAAEGGTRTLRHLRHVAMLMGYSLDEVLPPLSEKEAAE